MCQSFPSSPTYRSINTSRQRRCEKLFRKAFQHCYRKSKRRVFSALEGCLRLCVSVWQQGSQTTQWSQQQWRRTCPQLIQPRKPHTDAALLRLLPAHMLQPESRQLHRTDGNQKQAQSSTLRSRRAGWHRRDAGWALKSGPWGLETLFVSSQREMWKPLLSLSLSHTHFLPSVLLPPQTSALSLLLFLYYPSPPCLSHPPLVPGLHTEPSQADGLER